MTTGEWTVGAILKWSKEYLKGKQFSTARLDAEVLIADALGVDRVYLYTNFDQPLTAQEKEAVRRRLQRRVELEPVAYITGHREFFGRKFFVNSSVLIPRPDTEVLVEYALREIDSLASAAEISVLDIGAGTGCIGLTLALERKNVKVDLIEICPNAIQLLRQNQTQFQPGNVNQVLCGDIFQADLKHRKYQLIVSNPPYIADHEVNLMSPETKLFEPKIALFAKDGGLDFYRRFSTFLPKYVLPGGKLVLEIGYAQGDRVREVFSENSSWTDVELVNDLSGRNRVAVVTRSVAQE